MALPPGNSDTGIWAEYRDSLLHAWRLRRLPNVRVRLERTLEEGMLLI